MKRRKFLRTSMLGAGTVAFSGSLSQSAFAASASAMDTNHLQLSASEITAGIRSRRLTAVAYAKALIAQAEKWKALNAFITFDPERLIADARQVDKRIAAGEKVGPLAGLPLLVKDIIDTAEYPTTSGTPALRGYRPKRNAPALQRMLDAGAIVAGKTNLHEFAYGITSNNFYTGAVHNPYNLDVIPGGSSGGTAAAIAAGIGVAGLGTDTGGSCRIPAGLCGIAGLRTTLGRWPMGGHAPASHSRDVIGPIGRTVADLALLDTVVTGEPLAKAAPLRGVRLGVPRSDWTDLDPETRTVAEAALTTLQKAGVELVQVDIQDIVALDQENGFPVALFETSLDVPTYLIAGDTGVTFEELVAGIVSPAVAGILSQIPSISLDTYRAALKARAKAQSLYAACWEKNNIAALVFPTTPLPARPIGQEDTVELNGRQVPTFPTYIRNTAPASLTGLPGLSIPIGLTKFGLPVGLEFDGPAWHDRRILNLGLAAERLFPPLPPPALGG